MNESASNVLGSVADVQSLSHPVLTAFAIDMLRATSFHPRRQLFWNPYVTSRSFIPAHKPRGLGLGVLDARNMAGGKCSQFVSGHGI